MRVSRRSRGIPQCSGNILTLSTVEVSDAENVGGTALSAAVDTGASLEGLAVLKRRGRSGGSEAGDGENNSEELHVCGEVSWLTEIAGGL